MAQSTPWQTMRLREHVFDILQGRKNSKCKKDDYPVGPCCYPCLTYYHNGKENICCKPSYDYNFRYSEGYNQRIHRDDRRHPHFYMTIYAEEEYPCRTVPLLTNSNYGHRPPIDPSPRFSKKKAIYSLYRHNGFYPYCSNARSYTDVKLNAPSPYKSNQNFGYTFVPPPK